MLMWSEDGLNAYKGGKKEAACVQGACPHCVYQRKLVTEGDLTQFAAERGRTDLLLEASIILVVSLYWFFIRRGERALLREGVSKRTSDESEAQWEIVGEGKRLDWWPGEGWWEGLWSSYSDMIVQKHHGRNYYFVYYLFFFLFKKKKGTLKKCLSFIAEHKPQAAFKFD